MVAETKNIQDCDAMKSATSGKIPVESKMHRFVLACSSGVMLAAAFPPSPLYSLAYVALIPFLLMLETLQGTWKILRMSYLTFLIFHVATLYWIGGFAHGKDIWLMIAGGAVVLIHPLFYWPIVLLYTWVRKRLGLLPGLMLFIFVWTSYDFSHSLSEISFPWITLGNSQAYDLQRIQIAEFTSVYGLSFLVLTFNALGFVLVTKLATRGWAFRSRPALGSVAILTILYFGPWLFGELRMQHFANDTGIDTVNVGIVQPNVDPFDKWTKRSDQMPILLAYTEKLARQKTDLVVWPETAIPLFILQPQYSDYLGVVRSMLDSLRISLLTGLPSIVYYDSLNAPITAQKSLTPGMYYEEFNSTAAFVPGQTVVPVFRKIILVPFAERIPYAETFRFLIEPLKWNVGIGMWGIGRDTVVFSAPLTNGHAVRFSSVICYESVYPDFVRQFVKRGAQFLVIITNDSWWGNTSGAYQHASYASLRAVENRRWIVRSANGGISGLIDPTGRIHQETKLYTVATIQGTIFSRDEMTFYTKYGDIFGIFCVAATAILLLIAFFSQRRADKIP
jgi:apolipoprotein N-acyltransferase